MCTVSFIARKNGYALAMNRDEKLTRVPGLPPQLVTIRDQKILCPSEPGGGAWIALNQAGATLALINWYSVTRRVRGDTVSRGEVVKATSSTRRIEEAITALSHLPLERINPFRLIAVFPNIRQIFEWRWNLRRLACERHPWRAQQWISSGYDEPAAQRIRSATFRLACRQSSFGSIQWLRRQHRSHIPHRGPFSTCMHRDDAATVSYTEVSVLNGVGTLRYCSKAPCQQKQTSKHRMIIAR